jgi:kynurenine formamidase
MLPTLDVVKFSGDPIDYHKFINRFHQIIGSQNISDAHKMAHLMQFVEGKAKRAISGFDGIEGGLARALALLERRFGQPHAVAVQSMCRGLDQQTEHCSK